MEGVGECTGGWGRGVYKGGGRGVYKGGGRGVYKWRG